MLDVGLLILGIVLAVYGARFLVDGGSAIALNVFFTLGVTALIKPVPLDLALNQVILVNIGVTLLIVLFARFSRTKVLGRPVGIVLTTIYVAYIVMSLVA